MTLSLDNFRDLFRVTDELVTLHSQNNAPPDAVANVLAGACGALKALAMEKAALRELSDRIAENAAGAATLDDGIVHDLEKYLNFIDLEKEALARVGISEDAATAMSEDLFLVRGLLNLDEVVGDSSEDRLAELVGLSVQSVCQASGEAKRYVDRMRRRHALKKVGLEVSGWSIQLVNGSALIGETIATMGLNLSGASTCLVSSAAGRTLVTWSKYL